MAQRSGTWTTVAEFCDELGISRSTFADWRAKGRAPRAVLHNALDYVVERNLLTRNALPDLKWTPPKSVRAIDKRTVVNHGQATEQLNAMRGQVPSGPRLVPFFAVMHYAEARPGEAVNVRRGDVALPALVENSETGEWEETENGWGELLLSESAPETGARWSGTGKRRDRRKLKHRGKGDTRPLRCPPPLVRILREHLRDYPPLRSGRVLYGVQGGELSQSTYSHVWSRARKAAFAPAEYASPPAKRPYDLRHACVSIWLSAGVPPMQVAEWAGHSVAVLLQIYAKCLAGQQEAAMSRIQRVLEGGVRERPRNFDVNVPWMVAANRVQPGTSAVGKIRPTLRFRRSQRLRPCS